ncbi:MAG: pirin family protein [Bdellovibrionales bacterium]|nr:pirin family protein [Bdellovibrionales bacterium]
MQKTIYTANSRGFADHGWLNSHHTFSFANYYDPERMGFGALRVINDDKVAPSRGFGTHPHQNMEIISIPLKGALRHKDSEGNEAVIENGEVQLMSAGTGVFHSEYNNSNQEEVNFLQIWVLPKRENIAPRYDQQRFDVEDRKDKLQFVLSPIDSDHTGVKINQDAFFSMTDLTAGKSLDYEIQNKGNGLYIFVLEGEVAVEGETLKTRDAISLSDLSGVNFKALADAKVLLMEVPLEV